MNYRPLTKAVIPAAGYGTRFLPQAKAMPKEMLPLLDKPVIQYVVEELVSAGIKKIIIITGWSKRAIEDHFDNNFELEHRLWQSGKEELCDQIKSIAHMAEIAFIRQREIKGTGHAIACARPFIDNDEPFLVHWGDSVIFSQTPVARQLVSVWDQHQKPVLAMEYVEDKARMKNYGMFVGPKISEKLYQLEHLVEKPSLEETVSQLAVNTEFILTPRFFTEIEKVGPRPNGEIYYVDGVLRMAQEGGVLGWRYEGKRFDLGDKYEWLVANTEVGLARPDMAQKYRQYLERRLSSPSPIPDNTVG